MKTFGSRLRALRETRNWSQELLGFELGVTKATISKWESDQVRPGLNTLLKIKRLFSDQAISLDFLGEGQPSRAEGTVAHGVTTEPTAPHDVDPRLARSSAELQLLMRFRALSRRRQAGLLSLLGE